MNLGFFGPKMAVSWRTSAFQKKTCWNPNFYSAFWVRTLWAKMSKKENLKTHQKRKKTWLITGKLFFVGIFVFFCCFFLVFVCFFLFSLSSLFLFFCLFWGFKGQVRWPEGPPHLAQNPPYLFFCFCCLFCLLFFFERLRWGGPKGHLTWPSTLLIYDFFGGGVVFFFPLFAF